MAFTEADKTIYRPSLTMTVLKEVRQLQCESKYCRETSSGIYVIKKKRRLGKHVSKWENDKVLKHMRCEMDGMLLL